MDQPDKKQGTKGGVIYRLRFSDGSVKSFDPAASISLAGLLALD
jgi:hypothetical protein